MIMLADIIIIDADITIIIICILFPSSNKQCLMIMMVMR